MTATRQPKSAATSPVMPPASEAPRHQADRVMLITRPRSRAGQVSATSIEPSDHSPLSAKNSSRARDHEDRKGRRQRRDRHQQREQRDVDGKQRAPPEPVGQPRPEIEAGDADEERDLKAGAIFRHGQREFLDHQRRDQREDHAVHAVEAPAERIGDRDMPMRFRDLRAAGDGAIIGVLQMFLLERSDVVAGDTAGADSPSAVMLLMIASPRLMRLFLRRG